MEITIDGQNMDIGEALQKHVTEGLGETVNKYYNNAGGGGVYFHKVPDKHFRADITLSIGNGILLKASAEEEDVYSAFDHALNRIGRQLRKYKDRLNDHHRRANDGEIPASLPTDQYVLGASQDNEEEKADDNPVIVAETQTTIQTLSVSDALMHMDLADQPALLFRNIKNGRVNMLYRRDDGNIGWLDPKTESLKAANSDSQSNTQKQAAE